MSVDSLKAQRRQKNNEIKTFSKRVDGINKIISSIDSRLDDDVRDINNKINSCVLAFQAGLSE